MLFLLALGACGGGGGGGGGSVTAEPTPSTAPPAPRPEPQPEPSPLPLGQGEAARFVSQATFGPGDNDIKQLVETGPEDWFLDQLGEEGRVRPRQFEFARLNLNYTVMSKRKLKQLVEENIPVAQYDRRMDMVLLPEEEIVVSKKRKREE